MTAYETMPKFPSIQKFEYFRFSIDMKTPTKQGLSFFGLAAVLHVHACFAQVGSLNLSSGMVASDGTVSLSLTLSSPAGSEPAALEWTFTYPIANVVSISATGGAAAIAAGKSLTCNTAVGSLTCILYGLNTTSIANGVAANLNLTIAPGASSTAVGISNGIGALLAGDPIALSTAGGTVTGSALPTGSAQPKVSGMSCAPSSLGDFTTSTCTVTLSAAAPQGGANVTITNGNALLTAPTSVSVLAVTTAASFTVSTAAIPTDQIATLTATYNGSSAQANLPLVSPVLVSSLGCNPTSLGPNASTTCTVTLSKPAPASGATVAISNTNSSLSTAASITVPATQKTATFSATTAALTADSTATLTAAYNGNSATTTVNLTAPILVSSLSCNPETLAPSASTTCTVALNTTAPTAGITVTIGVGNGLLNAPASILIQSSSQGTFTLKAGSFISNQTGSVTAAYNGSSQTANINLTASTASPTISSLSCSPTGLMSGATSTCSVQLSQPAAAATTVTLTGSALISVPASVVIAPASTSMQFTATAGTINADTAASITAALGASSQQTILTLWSTPTLSSLTCVGTATPYGWAANCSVSMSKPAGNVVVDLTTSSTSVTAPNAVTVPTGATAESFTAFLTGVSPDSVLIVAIYNGVMKSVTLPIKTSSSTMSTSTAGHSMSCLPNSIIVGASAMCRMSLDPTRTGSDLLVTSSSDALRTPDRIAIRPGQRTVEFQVDAVQAVKSVEVAATVGTDVVSDVVSIRRDISRPVQVPGTQFVKYGSDIRFSVSAADEGAMLTTGELPAGAEFDSVTRQFLWTPVSSQVGTYQITFIATNTTGEISRAGVTIEVETGSPVVTGIVNAATRSSEAVCSPNAVASIQGRWLNGGTVSADGMAVPVLSGSPTELNILCPDFGMGTEFHIAVETDKGISQTIRTTGQYATPGIFTVDGSGSGQALALLEGTHQIVMRPNYRMAAQPAAASDRVVIYATGVNSLSNLTVRIGGQEVTPLEITAAPNQPGVFLVRVAVPDGVKSGDVPVSLSGRGYDSVETRSNTVSIVVE